MNAFWEAVALAGTVTFFIFLHKALKRANLSYRKAVLKRNRLRDAKKTLKGRML